MATESEIVSFINTLGNLAVSEANRRIANGEKYVLPSVCVAQSAHETGWGTSSLMVKANAFFGIKAGGSWTGKVYTADTWEVVEGEAYNTTANFRAYDSLADSVADYYDLIINNTRYSRASSTYYTDIKTAYDTLYEIWAGGYATDEQYVENVYALLTGRSLTQWDSKVDGVTFDSSYTWDGSSTDNSGSTPSYGDIPSTELKKFFSENPDATYGDFLLVYPSSVHNVSETTFEDLKTFFNQYINLSYFFKKIKNHS